MLDSNLSLVFMGTPEFAVPTLKALHEAGHSIAAVYTQPPRPAGRGQKESPSPVHEYALAHGLPVFTPASLKSPETQAEFAAHRADAAIVAAYGLLLPKPILEAYPLGCINVHPSLLPRWRGAAPIQRTVMAGDKETGIVIMQMDEGLDTGDMLLIERYAIPEGTTAGELHDTLAEKAGPLVLRTLQGLQDGSIVPLPQGESGVTYAKKISKQEAAIDWNQDAERIYHHILGLSPHPGAYFMFGGEHIKILKAGWHPRHHSHAPGTILDDQLHITCKTGVLHPATLQRPGKKPLAVGEFLRGFPLPAGTRLI
ncbi:MAG: methionyl-tRNA formyltransferase [Pseudomonadota bacterium]|nr:methionyl-tRNA formyltransferase [Pseudomonadota bacterium]